DREDFVGRCVQDFGFGVDEPADQPWTGDPVDLWPGPGYPLHVLACLCVERSRSRHASAAAACSRACRQTFIADSNNSNAKPGTSTVFGTTPNSKLRSPSSRFGTATPG